MLRFRPFLFWLVCVACLVSLGGLGSACVDTAATITLEPVTGIVVRADTITAGRGCGTSPTQVFKYVAAVYTVPPAGIAPSFVVAGVYDCFSDGVFFDLLAVTSVFDVHVFAYNSADFSASGVTTALAYDADAGASPDNDPLTKLKHLKSTWQTDCSATQLANIEVLAVCGPLASSGTAAVALDVTSFTLAGNDAGALTCGTQYASVQVSYESGGLGPSGALPVMPCAGAAPIVINVPSPPADMTFHVSLLASDGAAAGTVTCSAVALAGTAPVAVGGCTFSPP